MKHWKSILGYTRYYLKNKHQTKQNKKRHSINLKGLGRETAMIRLKVLKRTYVMREVK